MTPTPSPSPLLEQAATVAAAPWWGVPVVAGSFLVIGAVLGFWFNRLQDDRKAKREHDQRWYEHVRSLSAEAVALISEYISVAHRVVERNETDENDDPDAVFAPAQEVFNRLSAVYGQLTLVAPKELDDAMERIMNEALGLSGAFYRGDGLGPASTALGDAGTEFIRRVRSYLKVNETSAP